MSRPRSGSPRYRRFPWDDPDFDPHKANGGLSERSHRSREDPEDHWHHFGEDMRPEAQRRSPLFPDDRQFGQQRHPNQEEFYRRRPSPHHSVASFDEDPVLSPLRDDGGGRGRGRGGSGDRRRGGFRELFQRFDNRGSPPRVTREKLPPAPRCHPDHQQREAGGSWRREEPGRGRGRFRDLSPGGRPEDQRGGAGRERGRRPPQGPNRDKRREEALPERNPAFKRQRREMDDGAHLGYRHEEDFGEPRYAGDAPKDKFGGGAQGARHSGPLVVEHDHGIAGGGGKPPRWEPCGDRRDPGQDFERPRSPPPPRPGGSAPERFGAPDERGDARGRHFQDAWRDPDYHDAKRSAAPQDRLDAARYGNRNGPAAHRGRGGGPHPARGQMGRGQGGRTGPLKTQPRSQPASQGYQDLPREEQRPACRPFRSGAYEDPADGEPDWAEEEEEEEEGEGPRQWEPSRPQRPPGLQRSDPDPKRPRQRERGWSEQKSGAEETLTIKVDMSRPLNNNNNNNSSPSFSSDRQLSVDLVHVGRQRLDFLPMLEHSGTYRESSVHTGSFAREIISLVHLVKDQYFRGGGVSLNERFSTARKDVYAQEESEELTLDKRFSANRGFSFNLDTLLDEDEPLFSRLGPLQPVRGPGDLRHDLERRRQERLEGVTVTISGSGAAQRPLGPSSMPSFEYSDQDEPTQEDEEDEEDGFSNWIEDTSRRRGGHEAPRRGAPYAQRRNTRPVSRVGAERSNRSGAAGPNNNNW